MGRKLNAFTTFSKRLLIATHLWPWKPEVSIITSIYNGDRYITPFLEDITRQSYFNRCELILIDAASPGNEAAAISPWLKRFYNIKYIKLDTDPGIYEVWNMGIRKAKGSWITNANLDDRRHPEHIEKHIELANEHPDTDLVAAATLVTKNENETWEENSHYIAWFEGTPEVFGVENLFQRVESEQGRELMSYNAPHAMPVWRKDLHTRFGWFDEKEWGPFADWEFWLRCLEGGAKFRFIKTPLCLYLEDDNSHNRRFPKAAEVFQNIATKYYRSN